MKIVSSCYTDIKSLILLNNNCKSMLNGLNNQCHAIKIHIICSKNLTVIKFHKPVMFGYCMKCNYIVVFFLLTPMHLHF